MQITGNDNLSRKERERLWHKELILESAEELFSRKGFYMTNVQEIADAAEFSVGFLYNMFENKEEIYRELIIVRAEEYLSDVYRLMGEKEKASDKLRAVIRSKLKFFERHRRFFGIFSSFATGPTKTPTPMMPDEFVSQYWDYQHRLEEVYSEGIKNGEFAQLPPSLAVMALEGITNAIIGRWVRTGESEFESVDPELIDRILFEGFSAWRKA